MKYYLYKFISILYIYIVISFCSIIYTNNAFAKSMDNTEEYNINQLYCETSNIIKRNYYRYTELRRNNGMYQYKVLFNVFSNFVLNNKNRVFNLLIDHKHNKLVFSITNVYDFVLIAPIQYVSLSEYYKNQITNNTYNHFADNDLFIQSIDKLYAIDITDVDTAEILLAIDNAIEIIKHKPDSLEAIFIVDNFIYIGIIANNEIKYNCSKWINDNIGINVDLARKILYCVILSHNGVSCIVDVTNDLAKKKFC